MSADYRGAWAELERVLSPGSTWGAPHHCGLGDEHEESVDLLDCIAERYGIRKPQ